MDESPSETRGFESHSPRYNLGFICNFMVAIPLITRVGAYLQEVK
jgi:hypothetical protein